MNKDPKVPEVPNESLSINLKKMLADVSCVCPGYWGQIGTVYMDRDTLPKTVSQLFWIVKQILEANVEMQENFEELYKFVHDFFENLDLQEEVNNKIEEMIKDGTIKDILGDYILLNTDMLNIYSKQYLINAYDANLGYAQGMAIDSGTIYNAISGTNTIIEKISNGNIIGTITLDTNLHCNSLVIYNNELYSASIEDGIYKIDMTTGICEKIKEGSISNILLYNDKLIYEENNSLYILDNDEKIYDIPIVINPLNQITIINNTLWALSTTQIYSININTNLIRTVDLRVLGNFKITELEGISFIDENNFYISAYVRNRYSNPSRVALLLFECSTTNKIINKNIINNNSSDYLWLTMSLKNHEKYITINNDMHYTQILNDDNTVIYFNNKKVSGMLIRYSNTTLINPNITSEITQYDDLQVLESTLFIKEPKNDFNISNTFSNILLEKAKQFTNGLFYNNNRDQLIKYSNLANYWFVGNSNSLDIDMSNLINDDCNLLLIVFTLSNVNASRTSQDVFFVNKGNYNSNVKKYLDGSEVSLTITENNITINCDENYGAYINYVIAF